MKHIIAVCLSSLALTAGAQTVADSVSHDSGLVRVVRYNDTTDVAYVTLHENAPHVVNLKDVPRFAVLGKEGRFYIGIGANVKAIGVYDIGNPLPDANYFITSAIPMDTRPGNKAQFRFSAAQSNVYMNVVALPGGENQLGAYVSLNFLGKNYAPKLHLAYLKYRHITAGYSYTIFGDVAAAPPTIDYEGPNAIPFIPHGMIAYEPRFGRDRMWQAGVAIDMPEYSFTNAARTATVTQRVPDIPFYIQRYWADGKGWVRLSGMIRNLYYRNMESNRNIDKVGWGVKVSGTTPIVGGLSASYMSMYGQGIASYIQDLNGEGMDLMPMGSDTSRLGLTEAWGGYASLQYQFTPKLFATATYSHVRAYVDRFEDADSTWGSTYKYAQYVAANMFYNINSIVQVGVEYDYGRRVNFDGKQAHDNRLQAMLQVSF